MNERHVRLWLRLEGALVLVVSLVLYAATGGPWWLYLVLFLVPDLSMLGYLAGPVAGAWSYNVFHTYAFPLALGLLAVAVDVSWARSLALIWAGHIGLDRMLGYGLKLHGGFRFTHLGRIGKGA